MTNRNIQSTVATSNHTTNYDLPLWSGQDITTWQGNLNDAFNKIDTAMYENKTLMLGYQEIADKLANMNDIAITKVEEMTEQLADINTAYQEVRDNLAAANQKITEAEQAIINLQHEDDSVKVQMDTMQDDIGKLMDICIGRDYNPDTPYVSIDNSKLKLIGASCSGSSIVFNIDFDMSGIATGRGNAEFSNSDSLDLWNGLFPTTKPKWYVSEWTTLYMQGREEHADFRMSYIKTGDDESTFRLRLDWTNPIPIIGQVIAHIYYREGQ